ncbi:hypothetical protein WEI85_39055 [Actinomycetes bacterium KLBMP 9797]
MRSVAAAAVRPRRKIRVRAALVDPMPDEPTAVVVVGPDRAALVAALLGHDEPLLATPRGSYLVVRPGTGAPTAHLPGARQPRPYQPDTPVDRPPRRIEVRRPEPLLRHFVLVEGPDLGTLGAAGAPVLLDAVARGGALLYALAPGQLPAPAEREVLAGAVQLPAALFFAVPGGPAVVQATRDELAEFAGAGWFPVAAPERPADGEAVANLRRALVAWAGAEAMHRASVNPPVLAGSEGRVPVAPDAHESGWPARLDRRCRAATRLLRQRLAIDLADIHLRGVREIVSGGGCATLAYTLDQELHALSLRAVAECAATADRVLDDALAQVLGGAPAAGVRRRVVRAVREGYPDEPGADLARVLLVTGTGGVATVTGTGAVACLAAYDTDPGDAVLPPFGLGLSGACYGLWRGAADGDVGRARTWLQQALRGVELELLKEVSRRFEVLHRSLGGVLAEAVDHGILLI